MLQYVYAAMWFAVGLILIFVMSKENRVFYLAGGYFLLLGAWWVADILLPEDLLHGGWGWGMRGVTAAVLAVCCYVYYKEVKKRKSGEENKRENRD